MHHCSDSAPGNLTQGKPFHCSSASLPLMGLGPLRNQVLSLGRGSTTYFPGVCSSCWYLLLGYSDTGYLDTCFFKYSGSCLFDLFHDAVQILVLVELHTKIGLVDIYGYTNSMMQTLLSFSKMPTICFP